VSRLSQLSYVSFAAGDQFHEHTAGDVIDIVVYAGVDNGAVTDGAAASSFPAVPKLHGGPADFGLGVSAAANLRFATRFVTQDGEFNAAFNITSRRSGT
jgi:hypothetical protein